MKFGKILIYLAVLVALALYVYLIEIKHKGEQKAQEEKASQLLDLKKENVTSITLKSKERGLIEATKIGDDWLLTAPLKTKADKHAIDTLIHSIVTGKREKLLKDKVSDWTEYGLADPKFVIELGAKDQKSSVSFGELNPAKASYYVRVSERPELYLVADTLKNSLDKTPFDLRDKTVVALVATDVDQIVYALKDQEIQLKREGPDKWTLVKPEKMRLKSSLVNSDLRSLTNLTAQDIIDQPQKEGDPYGLDNPEISILLSGDKRRLELQVGKPVEKKDKAPTLTPDRYARVKGNDTVYVITGLPIKNLHMDPEKLRDRSLMTFDPANVEKLEVGLDDKKWVAIRGKDNKWDLEEPQKKKGMDTWLVSRLLWDFKDLEWKSRKERGGKDLATYQLASPTLVAKVWLKGEKEPLVLSAGWEKKAAQQTSGVAPPVKAQEAGRGKAETHILSDGDAAPGSQKASQVPAEVHAVAQPYHEEGYVYVLDGNPVERLINDLEELAGKK
jgi:hypothetical protein